MNAASLTAGDRKSVDEDGSGKQLRPSKKLQVSESVFIMDQPDDKQTLSTLNKLIETLKDGEMGYQQAADETQDADLKTLFGQYAQQRHDFANALQNTAYKRGDAKPENSGSVASTIHRGWINLKSALTNQDRHAILAECERGEDSAKKTYADALKEGGLTAEVQAMVEEQHQAILTAHDTVKKLRDEAKED